jgi:hypothetical protein
MATPDELVGRFVLRNFGKHGLHKGTITSYDPEGELTFRVEYVDGDFEDLSEEDVLATLVELPSGILYVRKRVVRVTARSRRAKDKDDSDCEYFEALRPMICYRMRTLKATIHRRQLSNLRILKTRPLTPDDTQQGPVVVPALPNSTIRRRTLPSTCQRSTSSLWVASPCPSSICVHFNPVDRGLCAQTLREHHVVLERAMSRIFPRFKWGRSHYLQV